MTEILIASSSVDEVTYGPVVRKLEDKGFNVLVYNSDRIFSGTDSFSLTTTASGELNFSYNGVEQRLESVNSAWYRQPNMFGADGLDVARDMSLEGEIRALQDSIWGIVPEESWLNSPHKMHIAQDKIGQLSTASSLGFNIPQTIVSNSWEEINSHLQNDDIVIKMPKGVLSEVNGMKVLYTTRLDSELRDLLSSALPFPAIFQSYQAKAKEWRVTVVGEHLYAVAIYTADEAKDDWRKHQFTKKVDFRHEALGDDINSKCIQFLGQYGLKYGAFDLVEDNEGKITFLECNPNGQFMWLEQELGLTISNSIADELARRAKN